MAFLLEKNTGLMFTYLFWRERQYVGVFPEAMWISGSESGRKNWLLWKLRGLAVQARLPCCRCFRFCLCSLWQCGLAEMISALSSVRWVELLGLMVYWADERIWWLVCLVSLTLLWRSMACLVEKQSHRFLYAFSDANTTAYRDLGIADDSSMQNLCEH